MDLETHERRNTEVGASAVDTGRIHWILGLQVIRITVTPDLTYRFYDILKSIFPSTSSSGSYCMHSS
jgi:hypothetical protein